MIITKTVELKVNNRYVKYYKNKGYNVKGGDIININVEDLSFGSNVYIDVNCDCCGINKKIKYTFYNKYTKNQTKNYYCNKCNDIKRKETNLKLYGVDNVFKSDKIKNKIKQINIDKYGVESFSKTELFIEKTKATNLKRYNYCFATQNPLIKEKTKQTNLNRYNVTTTLLYPPVMEKIKNANLKLYGVDNVFKSSELKQKYMINKHGVKYSWNIIGVKEKSEQTCLIKYGFKNPMSNNIIKNKMIKTQQELGYYIQDNEKTEFYKYKLEVKRLTLKIKNKLYSNWNGIDYYDGEYIKNNIKLNHNDKKYPTIDHKTSIYNGFKNNIDAKIIADIYNLCITKRYINSSKNNKNTYIDRRDK